MSKMPRIAAGCGSSPNIRVAGALRTMAKDAVGHRLPRAICRPKSWTKLRAIPAIAKKLIIITLACMSRWRQIAISNATTAIASTTAPMNRIRAVVGEKLTPEQAARKLVAVATTIPQLTILGIAGPGEALADPKTTFKTFELAVRAAPDIKLCLPTNGLDLPRRDMPLQNRPPHPSTRSIPKPVPGYINILGVSPTTSATPESGLRNESPLANYEVSRCSRKRTSCARSIQ
ncbi:hypothetical protein ACVWW2_001969 [Bradyrhizobium sp. LM4.3]